ncbi:MAG: phenylalanine--tRNA ligase subunit beta [Thermodesulfobacteriota bacterium]
MKISLQWLKEYVPIDLPVADLSEALTMAGFEVEGVFDRHPHLNTVVTGRVTKVSPHPDADRLTVCEVDAGGNLLTIVCGAPNVRPGMITAVALPGTALPSGMTVKKSKIRGVVSEGMLCSAAELATSDGHSGILDLAPSLAAGRPLAEAMGLADTVLDLNITPNRADCLSLIGIGREVAAICGRPLKKPPVAVAETAGDINSYTSIAIDEPDLCPRYTARVLVDVAVGPSPSWLKDRLLSVGLKPINNVVDITNFVMMETGQPLHAFDLDRLAGSRIVVRRAGTQATFTTLDDKERALSADMLMICDAEKPVAVAGVMGGLNSEIGPETRRVLIESAHFTATSIRKTAKLLGLGTDASYRFERGTDPEGTVYACDRAAGLMTELAGAKAARGIIDNHPRPAAEKRIFVTGQATNLRLGTSLNVEEISRLLASVQISSSPAGDDRLEVTVPSFRVDIERPEDIMEEVARLWGYNNISVTFPVIPADGRVPSGAVYWRNGIKDIMTGLGFSEVVNYSFIGADACASMRFEKASAENQPVPILNPLSQDQTVMRTSLIPGLLKNTRDNLFQQEKTVRLFEAGKVFLPRQGQELPDEPEMMAGIWSGSRRPLTWHYPEERCDFYDIKGVLESLLAALDLCPEFTAMPTDRCRFTRPGHTASIFVNGAMLGLVGEVRTEVLAEFGIRQPVFLFEINFSLLLPILSDRKTARPISRFPSVSRDVTLIVDKAIEAGNLLKALARQGQTLIEQMQLVAVYEGEPVPPKKKSVSVRIVYRSFEETLKDDFVNRIHTKATERLIREFNAELPG